MKGPEKDTRLPKREPIDWKAYDEWDSEEEVSAASILDALNPIQRTIFSALYALDGMRYMSPEEIAEQLNITIEEVEEHEKEAFWILRLS